MFRFRCLLVLLWSSVACTAAAAAPPTPLSLLEGPHLISSSSFILSHATYAQYRLHWKTPATEMTALFGTDAETPAQASQVRWFALTVALNAGGHLSSAAGRALLQASQTLAAGCFRTKTGTLNAQIAQALAKAEHQAIVDLSFGPTASVYVMPIGDAPAAITSKREITVELHLPTGKPPRCRMVPE
ncbi:hypothetical protein MF271_05210 [Deinococcus sp. KNUC1210]|uniref:hypothetical protein n=1 Tax=Deinococcus sp. KNUC1210 TaxID=2917691 RepID=UPI001EF11A84|nr:hypothetical protein [Deinococcus sp. KNUC1210]ULH16033.1 hypothetical protein MF271_05210 [Deinococcus sp. KNUC1210]